MVLGLIAWSLTRDNTDIDNAIDEVETSVIDDNDGSMLGRIMEDPSAYVGQEVTVEGEVQDVWTNRVIKISDDMLGDELTVFVKSPLTDAQAEQAEQLLADNANVEVKGTLQEVTLADFEQEFDIDITPEYEADFTGKTVLVADSIRFTDQADAYWEFM
ncbi:hypothetical protein B7Y94_05120 [Candidatus Saccharibacteria bacterium 32-49-12]|nr:MAG: hypothetical protein B7Y94_05120 [Candidatus Saccharibacteria bacterium 32-49-12]